MDNLISLTFNFLIDLRPHDVDYTAVFFRGNLTILLAILSAIYGIIRKDGKGWEDLVNPLNP